MEKELAAIQEICDEVEGLGRLEGKVELYDERMGDLLHDITLDLRVVDLVGLNDEVLLERLDGVYLLGVFFLRHINFAKGAPSDHFQQCKVLDRNRFIVA